MSLASKEDVQTPCKRDLTPLREVGEQMTASDEKTVDALSRVLEEVLSVSYLRDHAHEVYDADTADPASPASLLAAMDDGLTVPMTYLVGLPAVREVIPIGLDNERTADLFVSATRMSQKIVLHNTQRGLSVGPFPQALPRSRCTLHIQGVSSTVTVADVQDVIPRQNIFHFYRLSPESINVAFENARSAKEAFVLLQGKPIGGCTSVQVKMRMENEKHPQALLHRRHNWTGAMPKTASTPNNNSLTANATAAATANTNTVSPVAPIDAFVPFSKMEELSSARSPWVKVSRRGSMLRQFPSMQQQQHADIFSHRGGRRGPRAGLMSGFFSDYYSPNMQWLTIQRYMWNNAAAAATNANDAYQRQWDENECPSINTAFGYMGNGAGMQNPALTPPFPVGDDHSSPEENAWLACGPHLEPEILGYNAPYTVEMQPFLNEDNYVNLPTETTQSFGNGPACSARRRRVQRDPYKGGILVDSPEVSNNVSTVCVSPGSVASYKPRPMDCRILSPRMLHPEDFTEPAEQAKPVSSMTDDESPAQLTPCETNSQAHSDAESGVRQQVLCEGG
ncbi:hypothetical protein TCSYLVIO_005313 [Trypanosoma cruzi]|nr:hypothetical protein TCSYLVIO_005313 [Trypanosoma cruzi]